MGSMVTSDSIYTHTCEWAFAMHVNFYVTRNKHSKLVQIVHVAVSERSNVNVVFDAQKIGLKIRDVLFLFHS